MLKRVELVNFQAHGKLDIPIGQLTSLVGPSNSGKSAVLRAIAGLLRNDSASAFVQHGKSKLTVRLHLEDGHIVEWQKGKDANGYVLTRPDGTSSSYAKVGTNVPEEISDVLRMGPILLEDGSKAHINLHEQADSPFLVFDTPGQVAKVFGELTSAGKLFSAANEGNRRIREDKKRRTLRQDDIEKLKSDLSQYADLDDITEKMEWVQSKLIEAKTTSSAAENLEALLSTLKSTESELSSAASAITALTPATLLDFTLLSNLQSAASSLDALQSELSGCESGLTASVETAAQLTPAVTTDLSALTTTNQEILDLGTLQDELRAVHGQADRLLDIHSKLERSAGVDLTKLVKVQDAIEAVTNLHGEYALRCDEIDGESLFIASAQEELDAAVEAMSKISACPTCLQPLSDGAKEHLFHA